MTDNRDSIPYGILYHTDLDFPLLTGWYWACECDDCMAALEREVNGPFQSEEEAAANRNSDDGVPASLVIRLPAPGEITGEIEIIMVRSSTEFLRECFDDRRPASIQIINSDRPN